MGIYARHLLGLFLLRFAWVFLLVQGFAAMAAFLGFLTRHPYVPATSLLARLPDFVLLYSPVTIPFCVLIAGCDYAAAVRRTRGFFWAQVSGRDPRWRQAPIVLFGVALGLACWWSNAHVIPQIHYSARHVAHALAESSEELTIRLVEDASLLEHQRAGFRTLDGSRMLGFHMISEGRKAPMAVTAASAELAMVEDSPFLQLSLTDGRLLQLDGNDRVDRNLEFDRLRMRVDSRELGGPSKLDLVDLRYYTDGELDLLRDQYRYRSRRGFRASQRQKRRVRGVGQIRASRVQAAVLVPLVLLMVVTFLGVHDAQGGRARTVWVVVFVLAVLLPMQMVLEKGARQGSLPGAWAAWGPTFLVAAAFLGAGAGSLLSRRGG